jgi:hypothetical protein
VFVDLQAVAGPGSMPVPTRSFAVYQSSGRRGRHAWQPTPDVPLTATRLGSISPETGPFHGTETVRLASGRRGRASESVCAARHGGGEARLGRGRSGFNRGKPERAARGDVPPASTGSAASGVATGGRTRKSIYRSGGGGAGCFRMFRPPRFGSPRSARQDSRPATHTAIREVAYRCSGRGPNVASTLQREHPEAAHVARVQHPDDAASSPRVVGKGEVRGGPEGPQLVFEAR